MLKRKLCHKDQGGSGHDPWPLPCEPSGSAEADDTLVERLADAVHDIISFPVREGEQLREELVRHPGEQLGMWDDHVTGLHVRSAGHQAGDFLALAKGGEMTIREVRDKLIRDRIMKALRSGPKSGLTRDEILAATDLGKCPVHIAIRRLQVAGVIWQDKRLSKPSLFRLL